MAIRKIQQAGLTLIEMLVVVAIFAIVASILFFNFSDFNTNVSVRNLSQEMALMIRKAQTYATGVHNLDGVAVSSDLYPAYGMSFSSLASSAAYGANAQAFVLFADTADNNGATNRYYDNSGSCGSPVQGSECVEVFSITTGDKIVNLCTDQGCSTNSTVNIVFRRPSPDAEICIVSNGVCSSRLSFVKITIQSARGLQREIAVWNTGQISVQ
ncbi:MAG: pilus assembly FimT family protein [Minisyncoccia bacterium]